MTTPYYATDLDKANT